MASVDTQTEANPSRRRGFIALALVVVIGGLAWGAYWEFYARHFESTDDAYVATDLVQITSEIPGTVISVNVDDTQSVKRGQVLVELDAADAKLAMAAAESELARTVRQVRALYAQGAQFRAQIAERSAALAQAQADHKRRQGLDAGAVSAEEIAHTKDAITLARAGLAAAREQLQTTLSQTEGVSLENHPLVLAAAIKLRNAALTLKRTHITAPVDGVIARRSVQLGSHVAPGAPLMALVPLADAWVDANFKEAQLQHMRVGQNVELHADLYGDDVAFHGRILGLAAGSGSAFALLPAQNASGNWIKVVQRVPVRIGLDPQELLAHPLRVGLSMAVRVDIRNDDGAVVAASVREQPKLASDAADESVVNASITQIILQNAGAESANP